MSPYRDDFVGELTESKRYISGFGGAKKHMVWEGTLKWTIEDDDGCCHDILIPRSLLVEAAPYRLMSPQHWEQEAIPLSKHPDDTYALCYHNRTILHWGRRYTRTVPVDDQNVFTMTLASGYQEFSAYCIESGYDPIHDDLDPDVVDEFLDDESVVTVHDIEVFGPNAPAEDAQVGDIDDEDVEDPFEDNQDVSLDGKDKVKPTVTALDGQREDPSAELLKYHYKFGHIGFRRLKEMASQGIIPARLAQCSNPVCAACLYGKAHRRPRRVKNPKSVADPTRVLRAGDCVSVDVMVSATPGLIAQMRGFLTRQRYKFACVFVDHFSDFGYVHLMKDQSAESALEAKEAFEAYAESHGVDIKH